MYKCVYHIFNKYYVCYPEALYYSINALKELSF